MIKILDESYERVNDILDDIGFACDTEDDYEQWEDIARPSFETVLDELDTDQFNMTWGSMCMSFRKPKPEHRILLPKL